eukprot:GFUD01014421.1.p1 GENE.GFUD01014421.1~~GFUD01014421.1.p1  ORF type:complete len:402 (+),score=170.86 GFUD01014421.1:52-1257(+)
MSHLMKGKKYGLVMPSKAEPLTRVNPLANSKMSKPSIFGHDSSDSDDGAGGDWVKKSLKVKSNNSGLKKQAKIQMAKALEEDPTVFQYDEVYDDIEKKKEVEKESKKDVDRKPKYVHNLLKAADERQKEFERRIERQVQKEREKEGDEFADKESFVTSAYRKKMEEIAKEEEEEARMAQIENVLDVTKQNNMDGFYRHLYRQTMGEEKGQIESKVKKEEPEETEEAKAARVKEEMKKIKIEDEIAEDKYEDGPNFTIKKIDRKKEFRKKEDVESSSDSESGSSSEGESDNEASKKDVNNDTVEGKVEQRKLELKEQKEKREKRKRKIEQDASSSESEAEVETKKVKPTENIDEVKDEDPELIIVEESKPKIDIWKKRTVGEVYDKAVGNYWERKASREAGS